MRTESQAERSAGDPPRPPPFSSNATTGDAFLRDIQAYMARTGYKLKQIRSDTTVRFNRKLTADFEETMAKYDQLLADDEATDEPRQRMRLIEPPTAPELIPDVFGHLCGVVCQCKWTDGVTGDVCPFQIKYNVIWDKKKKSYCPRVATKNSHHKSCVPDGVIHAANSSTTNCPRRQAAAPSPPTVSQDADVSVSNPSWSELTQHLFDRWSRPGVSGDATAGVPRWLSRARTGSSSPSGASIDSGFSFSQFQEHVRSQTKGVQLNPSIQRSTENENSVMQFSPCTSESEPEGRQPASVAQQKSTSGLRASYSTSTRLPTTSITGESRPATVPPAVTAIAASSSAKQFPVSSQLGSISVATCTSESRSSAIKVTGAKTTPASVCETRSTTNRTIAPKASHGLPSGASPTTERPATTTSTGALDHPSSTTSAKNSISCRPAQSGKQPASIAITYQERANAKRPRRRNVDDPTSEEESDSDSADRVFRKIPRRTVIVLPSSTSKSANAQQQAPAAIQSLSDLAPTPSATTNLPSTTASTSCDQDSSQVTAHTEPNSTSPMPQPTTSHPPTTTAPSTTTLPQPAPSPILKRRRLVDGTGSPSTGFVRASPSRPPRGNRPAPEDVADSPPVKRRRVIVMVDQGTSPIQMNEPPRAAGIKLMVDIPLNSEDLFRVLHALLLALVFLVFVLRSS